MAIPDRNDPDRPLALAVNAARTLGVLLIVIAVLVLVVVGIAGSSRRDSPVTTLILAAVVGVYGVPGVLFLVFAGQLKQRKPWAAIVLIVMGGVTALFAGVTVARGLWQMAGDGPPDRGGAIGPMVFTAAVLGCAVLLIVHASRSLTAIRVFGRSPASALGFQPIMLPPAGGYGRPAGSAPTSAGTPTSIPLAAVDPPTDPAGR